VPVPVLLQLMLILLLLTTLNMMTPMMTMLELGAVFGTRT